MPGLLDNLAGQIYAGFKNKLRLATLLRPVPSASGGLDSLGDPISTTIASYPCQGFTDNYDEMFRARAGIPETDIKVCIFGASLPSGIAPQKDDQVNIVGQTYQIRRARSDPALALYTCQSFLVLSANP